MQLRTTSRKDSGVLKVSEIPENIGYYIAGFADGEGSFNVSFRRRADCKSPWKVSMCFNISQKDQVILALIKRYLQCGTMRSRPDGVWYFGVNNLTPILENVIPFFRRFCFLSSKKKRDFSKFQQIADLIHKGSHLTETGIREILDIRKDMNDGGKRTYSEDQILQQFKIRESSETIRQALACNMPEKI